MVQQDARLADRPMERHVCRTCEGEVLVRKSSWDQTSIQWDTESVSTCLERRAVPVGTFAGCAALRDSIRQAAVTGDLTVPDDSR